MFEYTVCVFLKGIFKRHVSAILTALLHCQHFPYREDGVLSLREVTTGSDHSSNWVNLKPALLVVLKIVGDHAVGALIIVVSHHPVDVLRGVVAMALRELDLKDLVTEKGTVVILVLHLYDHRGGGVQRRAAII